MVILLALAVLFWFWIGFKTWAFVATDLADQSRGKITVIYAFFGGLCWPATYAVLSFLLLSGVASQTIKHSINDLKEVWNRNGT